MATTKNPAVPIVSHIHCRMKKCHGVPYWLRLAIDEAESTITTPIRHRTATRLTSTQKLERPLLPGG